MPRYHYHALNSDGIGLEGVLRADNERDVARQLERRGLSVIEITSGEAGAGLEFIDQIKGGVIPGAPGLYVLGTSLLRRRRSTYISGAAQDTEELAEHLVGYLGGVARRPLAG